jgi:hypothetical protein
MLASGLAGGRRARGTAATDRAVDVGTTEAAFRGPLVVSPTEDPDVRCVSITPTSARLDVVILEPGPRVALDAVVALETAAQAVSLENSSSSRSRDIW